MNDQLKSNVQWIQSSKKTEDKLYVKLRPLVQDLVCTFTEGVPKKLKEWEGIIEQNEVKLSQKTIQNGTWDEG